MLLNYTMSDLEALTKDDCTNLLGVKDGLRLFIVVKKAAQAKIALGEPDGPHSCYPGPTHVATRDKVLWLLQTSQPARKAYFPESWEQVQVD